MSRNEPAVSSRQCHDCGVMPGERHDEGCDVALCVVCGLQQLQCDPEAEHGLTGPDLPPMQTWTGEWPGEAECREWGWWARWTVVTEYSPDGRPDSGPTVPCSADHPDALADLNRLRVAECRGEIAWSRERERYVRCL